MTNHHELQDAFNFSIDSLRRCSGRFLIAKVIRVVKRVHISGRWPTSRQYRFGRYVLGTMLNVVGSQRIKRARSARAKILLYIYIYMRADLG